MNLRPLIRCKLDVRDAALAGCLLLFASGYVAAFFDFQRPPVEDAAMLMRYSQHMAAGHGIVWNIGEAPVDGATDFLFMVTVALFAKLGLSIEQSVRTIALTSHILTVLLLFVGLRSLHTTNRWLAFGSALYLAVGPGFRYAEACFGTSFFALFATVTWYFAIQLTQQISAGRVWLFVMSSLTLGLIRPEGVLLAALMLIGIVVVLDRTQWRRVVIAWALTFLLLGGAYFAWRWQHFGFPLPNPYYKKSGGGLHIRSVQAAFENAISLAFPFMLILAFALFTSFARFFTRITETTALPIVRSAGLAALALFILGALRTSTGEHPSLLFGRYSPKFTVILAFLLTTGVVVFFAARLISRQVSRLKGFAGLDRVTTDHSDEYFNVVRKTLFVAIPVLGFLMMWGLVSNEMNYLQRFQYAVVPILILSWPSLLPNRPQAARDPITRFAGTMVLVAAFVTISVYQHHKYASKLHTRDGRHDVGMMLRQYADRGYTLATSEAGLLPLYSRWKAVDTWGLNDTWISHNEEITEEHLARHDPALIVFATPFLGGALDSPDEQLPKGSWGSMVRVLARYAENNNYTLAATYGDSPNKNHFYYVRPDFPESSAIIDHLRNDTYIWYLSGRRCLNYADMEARTR